jgi:hypothetical protein
VAAAFGRRLGRSGVRANSTRSAHLPTPQTGADFLRVAIRFEHGNGNAAPHHEPLEHRPVPARNLVQEPPGPEQDYAQSSESPRGPVQEGQNSVATNDLFDEFESGASRVSGCGAARSRDDSLRHDSANCGPRAALPRSLESGHPRTSRAQARQERAAIPTSVFTGYSLSVVDFLVIDSLAGVWMVRLRLLHPLTLNRATLPRR